MIRSLEEYKNIINTLVTLNKTNTNKVLKDGESEKYIAEIEIINEMLKEISINKDLL